MNTEFTSPLNFDSPPPPTVEPVESATDPSAVVATAFGVDPGFASTGVAAISRLRDGRLFSRGCWLIETEKNRNSGVRAGMDDARRIREIWEQLHAAVLHVRPNVIGTETYETRRPRAIDDLRRAAERLVQLGVPSSRAAFVEQLSDDRRAKSWVESLSSINKALRDNEGWAGIGLGNAAKTIGVVWTAACVAFETNTPFFTYTPTQLKVKLAGRANASKEAVGSYVESVVWSFQEHAAAVSNANRNHVHDAGGHALLALLEYEQWQAAYAPR